MIVIFESNLSDIRKVLSLLLYLVFWKFDYFVVLKFFGEEGDKDWGRLHFLNFRDFFGFFALIDQNK